MRGQRPTPRTPRTRVRGATIAAFVALAPLLPAAAVALGTLKVDAALPYVCTLPSGGQPVTVRISAAFPERADVGEEIVPTDVTTTVELPATALADLTALKAATVRPETRLAVGVAQGEQRAEATWSGTGQPVAVPAEGPLVLTTTGDVPSLTTDTAGELTLTAGGFTVDLALSTADGAATDPASLSVACVPGQDAEGRTVLARVPVGAEATPTAPATPPASPSSPSSSAAPSPSAPVTGLPLPSFSTGRPDRTVPARPGTPDGTAGGTPEGPRVGPLEEGDPADGETPATPPPRPDAPDCITRKPTSASLSAYVTGYSNVRKLNGAAFLPPFCMLIEQGDMIMNPSPPPDEFQFSNLSPAKLYDKGRTRTPPFTSTFLAFGFQPVRATMVLEQAGPISVHTFVRTVFPAFDSYLTNTVRAPLVLHVLEADVNGVKLDVGRSCRTTTPLTSREPDPATYPGDHMVLLGLGMMKFGQEAEGYILTGGGPLTGEVTIPAFKGCGANGESLDRLFTAAISGPGNHVKQIQGQTCGVLTPPDPLNPKCTDDGQPYVVPEAER
ncbi:DUF6801 domain-containing protein [Streptomyces filamentosus]